MYHNILYFNTILLLEHLGLALALNVPVYVVITKTDMCPQNVLSDTLKLLAKILKSPGCRKIPVFITKEDDITVAATNFVSERLVYENTVIQLLWKFIYDI